VRNLFFEWLDAHRPDLVPLYKRLYQRGAYLPPDERRRLAQLVKGPDLPPGERMRGRLEQRGANERRGANGRQGVGARSGWQNPGRPGETVTSGWSPEQGRLF
jgi:hypothetical protein